MPQQEFCFVPSCSSLEFFCFQDCYYEQPLLPCSAKIVFVSVESLLLIYMNRSLDQISSCFSVLIINGSYQSSCAMIYGIETLISLSLFFFFFFCRVPCSPRVIEWGWWLGPLNISTTLRIGALHGCLTKSHFIIIWSCEIKLRDPDQNLNRPN